jgi:acyl carrier protein
VSIKPGEVGLGRVLTEEEALNWVAQTFEEPPGRLTPGTARQDISTWDSMGVLVLMAEMDEKFGILLTDADIQSMNEVEDILAVLRRHGKLG